MREVDGEEEEKKLMKNRFEDRVNSVDKMARMIVKKMQSSASAMKLHCGCNHCGERDKVMSEGT